ncbi:DUF1772 domain-containing protein [Arthrobacter sp. HMWF013]|uniref:DUF1772 domain-containing protein n=1 Tax=Arthrobacter sp. HMWF013 TaxID=2056849 RepID=UPI000D350986|nr:DUF1772 domain-containing protein [Arthrobacter sp. HMWF013]PTT70606.1 hypothetical protein DBR22_00655 [Arthrobacter sp. HMWF013]
MASLDPVRCVPKGSARFPPPAVYSSLNGLDSALPVGIAWALHTATLAITFAVNIPLNDQLAQGEGSGQASARKAFEQKWTRWNLHRTWLSLASLVALSAGWAALGHSV